jgi:hypothetical protein
MQNNIFKLNQNIERLTREHTTILQETESRHSHALYQEREAAKREKELWQKQLETDKRIAYENFQDQV